MGKIDKFLDRIKDQLGTEEEIVHSVLGQYDVKKLGQHSMTACILVATDLRMALYAKRVTGYNFESIAYEKISSVEFGKKAMGFYTTIHTSGNDIHVKWIPKATSAELESLVNYIREKSSKAGVSGDSTITSNTAGQKDIVELLKGLAELKENGVLTDEEFDAQKQQLLNS